MGVPKIPYINSASQLMLCLVRGAGAYKGGLGDRISFFFCNKGRRPITVRQHDPLHWVVGLREDKYLMP